MRAVIAKAVLNTGVSLPALEYASIQRSAELYEAHRLLHDAAARGLTKRQIEAAVREAMRPVTNEYPADAQPYLGEVNRG